MKMTTKGIAAALCAGLAMTAFADSDHANHTVPSMKTQMQSVESLTRLAENEPTDATIRMKLALALDSVGMHEEAEWWRAEAMEINPEIATNGLIETGEEIPIEDLMARGAGVGSVCDAPVGPDVIIGSLHELRRWGQSGGITSYSVGTTSCNIGDERLDWFDNVASRHPVIAQDMFKWEPFSVGDDNGRFKQLGQSWLKHGFFALSNNLCCPSCAGTVGNQLGIGCADPYGAGLNGSFSELGPRSEVDGSDGSFPEPHSSPSGNSTLRGRIQVVNTELDQANAINADSQYLVDGLYLANDDAIAGNDNNNAAYRTINVSSSGTTHTISFQGGTQREAAAIQHWREIEPGVTLRFIDVPGDGRYIVGYNASDNGDGTWHYEYGVYNLTSEDACNDFTIPVADGIVVTNISFYDVDCHSGEPYDNTDWTGVRTTSTVSWSAPAGSASTNNAIRWGTMYNFGFDADEGPLDVSIDLGQNSGGSSPAFNVSAPDPAGATPPCPGDINNDGTVDTADLGALIAVFGTMNNHIDLNGDGLVDTADLGILIANFGPCPM